MGRLSTLAVAVGLLTGLTGCGSSDTPKFDPTLKLDNRGGADAVSKAKDAAVKRRDDEMQTEIAKLGLKGGKSATDVSSAGAPGGLPKG